MLTDKIFSPVDEAIDVPRSVSTAVLRRGDRLQVRLEGIAWQPVAEISDPIQERSRN